MHIRGRRAVFENQERYRHLIPQDFLNFTVNSVTLLLIGLVNSLVEKFIDLRIVVVTLVGKLGGISRESKIGRIPQSGSTVEFDQPM